MVVEKSDTTFYCKRCRTKVLTFHNGARNSLGNTVIVCPNCQHRERWKQQKPLTKQDKVAKLQSK